MPTSPLLQAFLQPDNQTLLWSIISKHALFNSVLTEPELWFQSILEMFFTQTGGEHPNNDADNSLYVQLKTLNQKTLLYMVQDLQKRGSSFSRNQLLIKPESISGIIEKETKMIFAVDKDEPIKNLDEMILEQQQFREKQDYIFPTQQQDVVCEKPV